MLPSTIKASRASENLCKKSSSTYLSLSRELVPLIPACPGSGGSQAAGGVGAHLCCPQWVRITHSIDHIPTGWEAILPNDLPQTLLGWLRCCRAFPQLSSAKEERHQRQCWKIHPHALCFSLPGILRPEWTILIIEPDLPDNPKFTPGFLHQSRDWQQNWLFEKDTGPQFKRLHIHLSATWLSDLSTATAQKFTLFLFEYIWLSLYSQIPLIYRFCNVTSILLHHFLQ